MSESTAILAAEISRLLKERRELSEALTDLVNHVHDSVPHVIQLEDGFAEAMLKARLALENVTP